MVSKFKPPYKRRILAALFETPRTVGKIAVATSLPRDRVRTNIYHYNKQGLVRSDSGTWWLTPEGSSALFEDMPDTVTADAYVANILAEPVSIPPTMKASMKKQIIRKPKPEPKADDKLAIGCLFELVGYAQGKMTVRHLDSHTLYTITELK